MLKTLGTLAAGLLALTVQTSAAQAQQFQVPVSADYIEFSLQFTGGIAAPYTVIWDVMEHEGQLAICGAGFLRDARFNAAIRQMARNASLTVDGQTRPVDLSGFRRARSINNLRSGAAHCHVVGALPRTNQPIHLQYGGATVRF